MGVLTLILLLTCSLCYAFNDTEIIGGRNETTDGLNLWLAGDIAILCGFIIFTPFALLCVVLADRLDAEAENVEFEIRPRSATI